jgi:hypothetical protein
MASWGSHFLPSLSKSEIRLTKSERLSCYYSGFDFHESQSENEIQMTQTFAGNLA